MPNQKFDFSVQLRHLRKGRPFSGASLGLPADFFDNANDWKAPLRTGTVCELLLLYGGNQRDLSQKEKRERFATALKVRDCDVQELTQANCEAIRGAIAVLPVEPHGLLCDFLDSPVQES